MKHNALLKNKYKDNDGSFIGTFVLDHVSENKAEDFMWYMHNGILVVLIAFFENLYCDPPFLKRRFVCNAKRYGQINKNTVWTGHDLTRTFDFFFHLVAYSLESVFPIQYTELGDTMLSVPKRPKNMLDIEVSTQHMSYPPLRDQVPKHIKNIELQVSLIDDIYQKVEGYSWHTHLDKENTRYVGKSQYR